MSSVDHNFSLDLSKFVDKAAKNAVVVIKSAFFELSTDIIRDTPIDEGRLINNWFPAVGRYDESTTEKKDKSGGDAESRLEVYNTFKLGDSLTFSNNLPYAEHMEFGTGRGGHSKKAPAGMVRINVARWQIYIDKKARGLR